MEEDCLEKMSSNYEVVVLPGTSADLVSSSDTDSENNEDIQEETKRPAKRQITKLPAHLKGLMGEANLRYARRDYDTAKKMCFEIIRQAPDAYEPYLTLAQMYENSNFKKYKGFLMLACHLQPSNANLWCRLAELELQESQINEAVDCYSKAIKAEPQNIALHLKRIELVEKKGDEKLLLMCKVMMARRISRKKHEQILQICKEAAQKYFHNKNYSKAIEALQIPLKRIPDKVTHNELNMILDLLLISERYSECIDIFTQFFGFTFEVTVEMSTFVVNSYKMPPEDLHVDLKVRFIICLVRLQQYDLVSGLIQELLRELEVETFGSLYLDIAEALMASGKYKEALNLLVPLVKSKNYSLAAIWLKHAECLNMSEMYDQAIDAYYTVMMLAPNHVEVLYPLAMLLLRQQKKQEALEVLSQDLSSNKLHVAVLIEQMKLLKQIEDLENYWKCCELLLSRHSVIFKNFEELRVATTLLTQREKIVKIKKLRQFRGQDDNVESTLESIHEKSVEEEYKLYREILQFTFSQRNYVQYQKLCFMGLCSKRFGKYFEEIYLTSCHSCLFNKAFFHGYTMAREILLHYPSNNISWNYFSMMLQTPDEMRHYRFFVAHTVRDKLSAKYRNIVRSNYLCGIGSYIDCLSFFIKEFKMNKSSYAALMIGVCMSQLYFHRVLSKKMKKTALDTIVCLFINYAKSRSKYAAQEVFYNLGRMYQQFGIMYLAEKFYKMVLNVQNSVLEKNSEILGLKEEAAYNLHLMYKSSGNYTAARNIIMQYIVV